MIGFSEMNDLSTTVVFDGLNEKIIDVIGYTTIPLGMLFFCFGLLIGFSSIKKLSMNKQEVERVGGVDSLFPFVVLGIISSFLICIFSFNLITLYQNLNGYNDIVGEFSYIFDLVLLIIFIVSIFVSLLKLISAIKEFKNNSTKPQEDQAEVMGTLFRQIFSSLSIIMLVSFLSVYLFSEY